MEHQITRERMIMRLYDWVARLLLITPILCITTSQCLAQSANDKEAADKRLQELKQQRDEYFSRNGNLPRVFTPLYNYDPKAEFSLGVRYATGDGVKVDWIEAVKHFQAAAQKGHASAQYNLGLCYDQGKGVFTDSVEAVKWYRKAAEQGNDGAQYKLGLHYTEGIGISKDNVEAVKWYRKAAEQGLAHAQNNLGHCYAEGEGVVKDAAESVKWYRKAAEQGEVTAQLNLGLCYAEGKGVAKDLVLAHVWWNLAAAQSNDDARKNVKIVEDLMTRDQIATAERVAREFRPRKALEPGQTPSAITLTDSRPTATGTGFFITANGYLVTNYHVVDESSQLRVITSHSVLPARVVRVDKANDLALLKVEGNFPCLPVAPSRGVRLGSTVATVGFPNTSLQGFEPKLAKGEIASLSGIQDEPTKFQVSVPIQPGNSGGALVDGRGNVVGVIKSSLSPKVALASSGSLPQNVNYAIKSSLVLALLESVPEVAANLAPLQEKELKFEEVVEAAKSAAVLVLVY